MKKTKFLLFIVLCALNITKIFAQSPALVWAKSIGGKKYDYSSQVLTDSKGNVYTLGSYSGKVDFDPSKTGSHYLTSPSGSSGGFILKMDSNGNFVWVQDQQKINIFMIQADAYGNIYGIGYCAQSSFVIGKDTINIDTAGMAIVKMDSSGNYKWIKNIRGNSEGQWAITALVLDDLGGIFVDGKFPGTLDFDPGPGKYNLTSDGGTDIFIMKLDTSGKFKWARKVGGPNDDYTYSKITADNYGDVYIAGNFSRGADLDPGPRKLFFFDSIGSGMFILKLDSLGHYNWAIQNKTSKFGEIRDLKIDSKNSLLACGMFSGTCDFNPGPGKYILKANSYYDNFIQKLDSGGNFIWTKSMEGTSQFGYAYAIAIDAMDNIYSTGWFEGKVDFDPDTTSTYYLRSNSGADVYVQKLDSAGKFKWAFNEGGGKGTNQAYSISLDANANIYVTGIYLDVTNFDPQGTFNLASNGDFDIFIQKIREGATISGIEENTSWNNTLHVYPNPSTGAIVLVLGKVYTNASIEIRDMTGRLVFTEKAEDKSTLAIYLSAPAGMYIASVITEEGIHTVKIVKD